MISHFSQEPFEGTLHIEDADLQKMAKVLNDVNIKECPYFDLSDKYGNSARYYRENQWIPVSQELPEDGKVVIAIGKKGTWDVGTYRGFLGDNIHRWQWKKNTIKTVYWWMYKENALPEPYKGDEE